METGYIVNSAGGNRIGYGHHSALERSETRSKAPGHAAIGDMTRLGTYLSIRNLRRYILTRHLAFMAVTLLLCVGCYKWVDFSPVKEEQPVTMFDRYKLKFYGSTAVEESPERQYFLCRVSFLKSVPRDADISTIPIFVIDSFCFEGTCLDSMICHRPHSSYEYDLFRRYERSPEDYAADDLMIFGKELLPSNYYVYDPESRSLWLGIPATCTGRDVVVEIRASLLDRVTAQVIARESKRVQFLIKKKSRIAFGS